MKRLAGGGSRRRFNFHIFHRYRKKWPEFSIGDGKYLTTAFPSAMCRGMEAVLLYRGKESFVRDGILAMSAGDFLAGLSAGSALVSR